MGPMKQPYVYIMASRYNGTLYVGVTANLKARVWSHKVGQNPGSFTSRYKVFNLVYYEALATMPEAIAREKALKKLSRAEKTDLINGGNPKWLDLPLE